MKKWITIILIAFVLIGGTSAFLIYKNSRSPLHKQSEAAIDRVKEETGITKIEDTSFYNGTKAYSVIIGKDDGGKKKVAWVPEGKGKIIERDWDGGISKEEAVNKLRSEIEPKELLSIRLGYESVGPVWEITYLDDQEQLNYFYMLFSNGEWWKKIENL